MGSSWVQMLLPAGDETSRGGAAAPESDVLLSRDTELIRAPLNPSHHSELCHGFGRANPALFQLQLLRRAGAAPAPRTVSPVTGQGAVCLCGDPLCPP